MKNETMMTDFYELTMAQTYFYNGQKDKKACFDVFYRTNPFNGGYAIAGGLDNIIDYIQKFKFSSEDIVYLKTLGEFSEEFLQYLSTLRFTGNIYAVPDGTPIFPNEPIITVVANIIEAQIIETFLLTSFNHGTLVTTAAKRITTAAGSIPVMEFGARRARGSGSAIDVSKYAFVGGCVGTSNTLSAKENGIPVMGTMAHSLISAADSEYEAFLGYAKSNPNNCVFLVDTYDVLKKGIPNAIKVANDYLVPNGFKFKGIRIDSGDLAYLSKEARKLLDEAGFTGTKICLSNGLDEKTIKSLLDQHACIDSIGAGDNIAASNERLNGVYKLAAFEKNGVLEPRIKVSEESSKTITPGHKKVYRFYDNNTNYALADLVALVDEEIIPSDTYTLISPTEEWKTTKLKNYYVKELQVPVFLEGRLVYRQPSVKEKKEYCNSQFSTIYPEIKRSDNPHGYYVDLSEKLLHMKKNMIREAKS